MKDTQKISVDDLEDITGGSGKEREEVLSFIKEYYPDVKASSTKELKSFLETFGITDVVYHPNLPNTYFDKDGNKLSHEQFMQILRDSVQIMKESVLDNKI